MRPIFINSLSEEHSYFTFEERFTQICQQHKEQRRALAFAFILYDFTNAEVWKVLSDNEYWQSLHYLSGEYLTVFSAHYKETRRIRGGATRRQGENSLEYITRVSYNENPSELTNNLISRYFDDSLNVSYPSLLFFQVHDNQIIDYILVSIKGSTIEETFKNIKKNIEAAVKALKDITEENRNNSKEIFDMMEINIKSVNMGIRIQRITNFIRPLYYFLRIVSMAT